MAVAATARAQAPPLTHMSTGGIGLLQVPSARMAPSGRLTLGLSRAGADRHAFVAAQPLSFLEVTLRQGVVSAEPHWQGGLDAKVRLLEESRWRPAVAVGGRDLLGGGRLAGEFLVFSKRIHAVDLTAGLGWGGLAEGGLDPPLRLLDEPIRRDRDADAWGPRTWFAGPSALFAGMAARLPWPGLSLVLEAGGPPLGMRENGGRGRWPVSIGLGWHPPPLPRLELGLGLERGERLMLRLALALEAEGLSAAARPGHPPLAPLPRPHQASTDSAERRIYRALHDQGIDARAVAVADGRATAWLELDDDPVPARTLGRAARTLARHAPSEIEELTVILHRHSLPGTAVTLRRHELERAANGRGSPAEMWHGAQPLPAAPAPPPVRTDHNSRTRFALAPRLEQSLSEHGAAYVYRLAADLAVTHEPAPGLVLGGGLRLNLRDNLDRLDATRGTTDIPVRRDLIAYARSQRLAIEHAHLTRLWTPAPGWQARWSLGLFEEMFAGAGAEVLYRPDRARWAVGVDLNQVWKRHPEVLAVIAQPPVTTGHASLYYEGFGAGVTGALRVGRYLGADVGATLELTRRFASGARLGVAVTGTDAMTQAGDVVFGLTLGIPLGRPPALPRASAAEIATGPLGRDAGQRLRLPLPLYETGLPASYGRLVGGWPAILD